MLSCAFATGSIIDFRAPIIVCAYDGIGINETACNPTDIKGHNCIKNNIITENTPPSIAAGCIFYYIKNVGIGVSKKDISDICIISEVTINKCCKKLESNDKLFSKILKNKED